MVPTPLSALAEAGEQGKAFGEGFQDSSSGGRDLGGLRSLLTLSEDGNLASMPAFSRAQVFLIVLFILRSFDFFSFTSLSVENACLYSPHYF